MLEGVLEPLTGWIPADPVNFLIGAGAGAIAFGYLMFDAARVRRPARRLEAPGPAPEAAIHYEYRDSLSRKWKWLPAFVAIAVWLFGMWDREHGAFDLWKLAIVGVPALIFHVLHARRWLHSRPAVSLYRHGILLDSWRGATLVPWKDVAYVETDPPVSTGYQPNTRFSLLIGRKNGRKWRYFEEDFGDEAPDRFETIVELARRYVR